MWQKWNETFVLGYEWIEVLSVGFSASYENLKNCIVSQVTASPEPDQTIKEK